MNESKFFEFFKIEEDKSFGIGKFGVGGTGDF